MSAAILSTSCVLPVPLASGLLDVALLLVLPVVLLVVDVLVVVVFLVAVAGAARTLAALGVGVIVHCHLPSTNTHA